MAGGYIIEDVPEQQRGAAGKYVIEDVPQKNDWWDTAGLMGRAAFEGVTALPELLQDAPKLGLRLGTSLVGQPDLGRKLTGPTLGELRQEFTDKYTAQPQTEGERMLMAGVRGLAGGLSTGGMSPIMAGVSGLTSGLSSEAAKEAGYGPVVQTLAGLGGGMAPVAGQVVAKPITKALGNIGATIGASAGNETAINRLLAQKIQQLAGENADDIARANLSGTTYLPGASPTVGQSIAQANLDNPGKVFGGEMVGMERSLSGANGIADILPSVKAQQTQAVIEPFQLMAGGSTREAQDATQAAAVLKREAMTAPLRDSSRQSADTYGIYAPKLIDKIDESLNLAKNSAEDVRRMARLGESAKNTQVEGQLASQPLGMAPIGMPRLSGRYGYIPTDLPIVAEKFAQNAADKSLSAGSQARFAQMKLNSLAENGYKPLATNEIIGGIDTTLSTPGIRTPDITQQALGWFRDKVAKFTDENGIAKFDDLYAIKKEVADKIVALAKESNTSDRRLTAGLANSIKKKIDDAIVSAGAEEWPKYLSTYASKSRELDKLKVSQAILDKFQNESGGITPSSLMNVLGRGEDALLKNSLGQQRNVSLKDVMGGDYSHLIGTRDQLARDAMVKRMANDVNAQNAGGIASEETLRIPQMLSREAMIVNAVLKTVGINANTPVAREFAMRMKDPVAFNELLLRPKFDPLRRLAEAAIASSAGTIAQRPDANQLAQIMQSQ